MGSSKESGKNFGMYAGAGIDFALIGGSSVFGSFGGSFLGPDVEAGANFYLRERPFGIRAKYLVNVKSGGGGVFGLGLLYHFGL